MDWKNTTEREQFAEQAALSARKATGYPPLEIAVSSALATESPIEAIFAAWFLTARAHMLSCGNPRFALELRPQQALTSTDGTPYRIDFSLEAMDPWLAAALKAAGLELRIAVELDGHAFHERNKYQVAYRNKRDRDLSAMRWRVLHFSGAEINQNPMVAVVEVLVAGADALDQAKAALIHG